MASEIRVNRLSNRSGLSTITFANGGVQFSGITTFANGEFYVGTGATIINPSSNEFNFHTGGSNRFTINNSGANLGTGNITAVDATFTGNVSIGKTLTYEDVKNVDSVGVVTARTGVKITGGDFTVGTAITASSVTGNVTQDVGITTFSGSATWFKGLAANKDMYWSKSSGSLIFKDNSAALFGSSSDLQLYHDGTHNYISASTAGQDLKIINNGNFLVQTSAGDSVIRGIKDGAVDLWYDNSKKFETRSGGVTVTGGINLSGELLNNNHIQIQADNKHLIIGAGDDLRAYHNGTNSVVNNNTGKLIVTSDDIWFKDKDDGDVHAKFIHDGAVELYHNNAKKLETASWGTQIHGVLATTSHVDIAADNAILKVGASADLQLFHDGSHSYIKDTGAGYLRIQAADYLQLGTAATPAMFLNCDATDGTVYIAHNGTDKLQTTSSGVSITGVISFLSNNSVIQSNSSSYMVGIQGGATYMGGRIELRGGQHGSSGDIRFFAQGATSTAVERLRIMSDGQVNIGTTANYGTIGTAAVFQIYGSNAGGNVSQNIINHAAANASSTCDINIWQNYRLANRIIFGRENNSNWQSSATSAASYTAFYTNSAGTVAERLRITSAGEVLIGRNAWGSNAHPNDINKLVVTGTSPADAYDSQCYLEGSETSGAVNTGGALAFGGHDGSSHRNWANIYGMKENATGGNTAAYMAFHTRPAGGGPTERLRITSDGHVIPGADNSYDLGSSSKRWRNLYTTDLKLSNEGSKNDVDGTWGNYTIQEGENDLFLINKRSGKKYKFNLTEVL